MKIPAAFMFILCVAAGLVVLYVIDPLDPSTSCTPFCLAMILMALSLRQNVFLVATVSVVFVCLAANSLVDVYYFYKPPHPYFWLFQRMGLFLVVCSLSAYLAQYRTETQKNLKQIQEILSKLPVPVVISDAAGYITYTNEAMTTVFPHQASKLKGKRYIDLFMTEVHEGKAMRYYIDLFAVPDNGPKELVLNPFAGAMKMNAQLTCLGTGPRRVLLTVLQNTEKPVPVSRL